MTFHSELVLQRRSVGVIQTPVRLVFESVVFHCKDLKRYGKCWNERHVTYCVSHQDEPSTLINNAVCLHDVVHRSHEPVWMPKQETASASALWEKYRKRLYFHWFIIKKERETEKKTHTVNQTLPSGAVRDEQRLGSRVQVRPSLQLRPLCLSMCCCFDFGFLKIREQEEPRSETRQQQQEAVITLGLGASRRSLMTDFKGSHEKFKREERYCFAATSLRRGSTFDGRASSRIHTCSCCSSTVCSKHT